MLITSNYVIKANVHHIVRSLSACRCRQVERTTKGLEEQGHDEVDDPDEVDDRQHHHDGCEPHRPAVAGPCRAARGASSLSQLVRQYPYEDGECDHRDEHHDSLTEATLGEALYEHDHPGDQERGQHPTRQLDRPSDELTELADGPFTGSHFVPFVELCHLPKAELGASSVILHTEEAFIS